MKRVIVAVAIFLILAGGTALAFELQPGQWSYRAYDERPGFLPGPKQGICFAATNTPPTSGKWYSTTFKGWNGLWNQKPNGDGIKIYGTTGIISTAEIGRLVSDTKISGQYAHFFTKPVTTSSIGFFVLTWIKDECDKAATLDYSAALPDDSVEDGDPAIE